MKNLAKVITALEITNDVHFSMEYWIKRYGNVTVACAVGTYILIEDSILQFTYRDSSDIGVEASGICLISDPTIADFNAVAIEFDITLGEALYLFSMDAYDSGADKRAVQDRIQEFIQSKVVGVPTDQRSMGVQQAEEFGGEHEEVWKAITGQEDD